MVQEIEQESGSSHGFFEIKIALNTYAVVINENQLVIIDLCDAFGHQTLQKCI